MAYPSLTFPQLLENATRQELEQFISLLQGYLSIQHNDDGSHGIITATGLSVSDAANSVGTIGSSLKPSANLTYDLGGISTEATTPFYAWRSLLVGSIGWVGSDLSASGNHLAAWSDSLNGSDRLTKGNVATTQAWVVKDSAGNLGLVVGGSVDIGGVDSPMGCTIPRLVATAATFTNGLYERSRIKPIGEWTSPAYNAANFTASAGTWTVDSGDVTTYAYTLVGKTMTVAWGINASDVSSAAILRIAIPGGFTAARQIYGFHRAGDAGAASVAALCRVNASGTNIELFASAGGAGFSVTAADNTSAEGSLTFEVV